MVWLTEVARGHGLTSETLADLAPLGGGQARLKEDDFGLLRRYAGRSRLQTYFLVIAERVYLDWLGDLKARAVRSPEPQATPSRVSALPGRSRSLEPLPVHVRRRGLAAAAMDGKTASWPRGTTSR